MKKALTNAFGLFISSSTDFTVLHDDIKTTSVGFLYTLSSLKLKMCVFVNTNHLL